ncbi:hypothetical protein Cgig2_022595 [Carnegiea gigantea]|uniref:Uncharacterized protein n=1 Tax=Carnegiea gigantea TaxID=171969 RepID=A0A9Q1KLF1_9CARY|nr:hypothetical protein Cgig2_022595 [Carnegiea gigantea]
MAEYVIRHFEWDRRRIAFPLSPLSKDFHNLCLSYELAVAEEAVEDYELLELPQVIFYAMLLNEARRLGVLHGRALRTLELALTELHWSIFESWVWLYGDRIFEAQFRTKAEPKESSGGDQQEEGSEVEWECEGSATEGAASPFDDDKQGYPSLKRKWYNRRGRKIKNARYAHFPFHYGVSSPLRYQGDARLCEGVLHLALEESYTSVSSPPRRLPCRMPMFFIGRDRGNGG